MNIKLYNRLLSIAYTLCPINRQLRTSHIAFLLKGNKIVHIGWNKNRTHPINLKHPYHTGNVGIHAELDVCLKANCEDLSGYSMVVIRINRLNQVCNSKPCIGCQSVLKQFNIKKVWYSNNNGLCLLE